MTGAGAALALVPLAPLLLAGAVAWPGLRQPALRLVPWAALPGFLTALWAPTGSRVAAPWVLLGAELGLDPLGRVLLACTALLWLVAGLYGQTYLAGKPRRTEFFIAWLVALAGNLGVLVAQDALSFYLCFALMSFACYPLVIHDRSPGALRAGRVYLVLVILGEILLFAGLLLAVQAANSLNLVQVADGIAAAPTRRLTTALLLLGFGIKAGLVPLHVWLPLAHPAAPTPASAVLSGAMIKVGLLGWLRFLSPGSVGDPDLGLGLIAAGLVAAFYGVALGLCQRGAKALLAYSSVSQMGLMTAAWGIGVAEPAATPAALAAVTGYAVHHGLAKGALFLGVGVTRPAAGPARWLVTAGWVLPALALAGAPLTSGAAAKLALKAAAGQGPAGWLPWLTGFLPLAAVATTALMARLLFLLYAAPAQPDSAAARALRRPWLLLVAASALTPWLWPPAQDLSLQALAPGAWGAALWPVLLGGAIAATVRHGGWRAPGHLPPGDLLVLAGPPARWIIEGWGGLCRGAEALLGWLPAGSAARGLSAARQALVGWAGQWEGSTWVGVALLGLLLWFFACFMLAP